MLKNYLDSLDLVALHPSHLRGSGDNQVCSFDEILIFRREKKRGNLSIESEP
jgi:hypothetical protein